MNGEVMEQVNGGGAGGKVLDGHVPGNICVY